MPRPNGLCRPPESQFFEAFFAFVRCRLEFDAGLESEMPEAPPEIAHVGPPSVVASAAVSSPFGQIPDNSLDRRGSVGWPMPCSVRGTFLCHALLIASGLLARRRTWRVFSEEPSNLSGHFTCRYRAHLSRLPLPGR